ncbi:nucleotidyltransferase family protein [Rubrivirga sp.]|uniref:nucleotidyltransferase domain-containing protein n=1 Tax=Rubrivirga sp. TaxID=1885344 RepID=UPI003B516F7F
MEFELIRLGARAELGPEQAQAFHDLAAGALDWDRVLSLGAHHRVLPLLYVHLRDYAEHVPADVFEALRTYVQQSTVHVLFLTAETARIAHRFEADGVPFLVLKGPSLAKAYGSVGKRPFVDIDLLISRESFPLVERALLDLDFNERKRSGAQQSAYLSVHGEYTFGRQKDGFASTVDVHTRLVPFGLSYAPSFDHVLSRSRDLEAGGATVPVLSWEDLFLALAVNALKDQWNRLRLATDLAEVGGLVEDWEAVRDRARRDGALRTLYLGVLVASGAVGATFPPSLLDDARRDRRAVLLARDVEGYLVTSGRDTSRTWAERVRLNTLVQDGPRGWLRYASYAAARRLSEPFADPRR